jgi:hypothetical protein
MDASYSGQQYGRWNVKNDGKILNLQHNYSIWNVPLIHTVAYTRIHQIYMAHLHLHTTSSAFDIVYRGYGFHTIRNRATGLYLFANLFSQFDSKRCSWTTQIILYGTRWKFINCLEIQGFKIPKIKINDS